MPERKLKEVMGTCVRTLCGVFIWGHLIGAIVVALSAHSAALPPVQATLESLGAPAGGSGRALSVSPNGMYVAGSTYFDGAKQAFIWSEAEGMQSLGDLPGARIWSQANAVANNGVVVGESEVGINEFDVPGTVPFRWDPIAGMTNIGTLSDAKVSGIAYDISADGSTIVGVSATDLAIQSAFYWTDLAGTQPIHVGDGSLHTQAFAVSANGETVVGNGDGEASGWRWSEANGYEPLGQFYLGGLTEPRAVSSDGNFVVGYASATYTPNHTAFYWSGPGTIVDLGQLPNLDLDSAALGVSDDGRVVVGRMTVSGGVAAALWTIENGNIQAHDLKALLEEKYGVDVSGWKLEEATGISADGRVVVGFGVAPDGQPVPWRVVLPVPEPTVMCSLAAPLAILLAMRRRGGS